MTEREPAERGVAPPGAGATSRQPLRTWRAERLLTIRELARLAGVAPSTVYLAEAARTAPQPSVMRRIAAALGVAPMLIEEFRAAIAARARPR
jgi:transcriptional regulator with XRE-family HTH domain